MSGAFLAAAGSTFKAAGGGGGFTPADLFAGGEQGHWYEPDATWASGGVGTGIDTGSDLSGSSPSQDPSPINFPTLQEYSPGGLFYAEFDGSNDDMGVPNYFVNDTSDGITIAVAVRVRSLTGIQQFFYAGSRIQFRHNAGQLDIIDLSGTVTGASSAGAVITANTSHVIIGQLGADGTGLSAGEDLAVYLDGSLVASNDNPNATIGGAVSSNVRYGERSNNDNAAMDLYGSVFVDRLLTAGEISDLSTYLSDLLP